MSPVARVGPFQLLEPIGKGGMAEVWRARHDDGLEVAIKLVQGPRARSRAVREGFVREARAVARLRHRNVVTLYEVGTAERADGPIVEGAPYLVMELAAGTLGDRAGQLDWAGTHDLLEALLDALAHAHARGVVHRDIKPSNVLLAADGRPMLADFGLASPSGRARGGGTPGYMAPEQLVGGDVGPRTDLYALGCLAWAVVGGRRPWEARAPGEPLPPLDQRAAAPAGFSAWVQELTAYDPVSRPATAADARAGLVALAGPSSGGVSRRQDPVVTEPVAAMSLPAPLSRHLGTEPPTRWADPVPLDASPRLHPATGRAPSVPERWRERPPLAESPRGYGLSLVGLREPPVIGREAEQRVIWEQIREVAGGQSRVILLRGPEGSGRTHLGRWALRVAHEHGVAAQVESRADNRGPEGTPGALVAWLREVSGARAAAWLVDDVHLEPSLLGLVARVLSQPDRPPLLVVLTADPGEAPPDATVLDLAPLTRRDGLQLVEHVFGLRGTAADELVERAAGNPGLAVALVRDWRARGLLASSPQGLSLVRDPRSQLPQGIAEVEAGRIAAVPVAVRAVLEAAAVIGGVVEPEAWAAVGPYDPAAVDALEAAGFVEPVAGGVRLVRPSLATAVREVAEAEGRWAAVAGRFVAWAQDRLTDSQDGPALLQLARAQEATGGLAEAAVTLERAGTSLRRQGHTVASTAALVEERRIRTQLGQPPGAAWVRSAFQLALNAVYQHRYGEAEEWIAELERAQSEDPAGSGRDGPQVARGRMHQFRLELEQAGHCYAEAERVGREDGSPEVVAYMLQSQGNVLRERGKLREALPLFDEAEATYRGLGNERDALGVAICRVYALDGLRDDAVGPLLDQVIDRAQDDPNLEITGRIIRGHRRRRVGELEGAEADYGRALRLVLDLGSARLPMPLICLAAVLLDRGQVAEAREAFLGIEARCRGMYALFWQAASLPAFALDPNFEARLQAFLELLHRSGSAEPGNPETLEHAARVAESGGRTVIAARCRAAARALEGEMAGLGKDA